MDKVQGEPKDMNELHSEPAVTMVSVADCGIRLTLLSETGATVAAIELDTGEASRLARELLIAAERSRRPR